MKIPVLEKSKKFPKVFLCSIATVLVLNASPVLVQAADFSTAVAADAAKGTDSAVSAPVAVSPLPAPPADGLAPMPLGPGLEEIDRDALLDVLGASSDELRTALESGQSLAQIAESRSVDPQKIADLATQALKERLSRELKDGVITQSQYEARLSEAAEHAAAVIKRTPPAPPQPGLEPDLGLPLGPGLEQLNKDALLQLLGISSDNLAAQLRSGQSLAAIATAQGVDVEKVTDLLAQTMLSRLDQELSEKSIWKDEYETRKQEIASRASDAVQHTPPVPPHMQLSN